MICAEKQSKNFIAWSTSNWLVGNFETKVWMAITIIRTIKLIEVCQAVFLICIRVYLVLLLRTFPQFIINYLHNNNKKSKVLYPLITSRQPIVELIFIWKMTQQISIRSQKGRNLQDIIVLFAQSLFSFADPSFHIYSIVSTAYFLKSFQNNWLLCWNATQEYGNSHCGKKAFLILLDSHQLFIISSSTHSKKSIYSEIIDSMIQWDWSEICKRWKNNNNNNVFKFETHQRPQQRREKKAEHTKK